MSSGAGAPTPIDSINDLVAFIRGGIKTPDARRIGLEHEKFGFHVADDGTMRPLPYTSGIEVVLSRLADRFGWEPVLASEDDITHHIVGLTRGEASVSLEPGGQLELSGAPFDSLDAVANELEQYLAEVLEISEPLGLQWLTMGARPFAELDDIEWVPKPRYRIMREYLPKKGRLAHSMMKLTCTVQANFDFTSEEDAASILNTVLRVTPLTSAIFASSPFRGARPTGHMSTRCHYWTDTDPDRTGYFREMLEPGYRFGDYVERLLDVPMFFIEREGRFIDATHLSFREYLDKGLDGHRATEADWGLHMSTMFPEVRLKRYIEVRGCDCVPPELMMAFAALWTGILYDDDARKRAAALTDGLDFDARLQLHRRMIDAGLAARVPGTETPLRELAPALVEIAQDGLEAQDRTADMRWLEPLVHLVIEPGVSLAEQMVGAFREETSVATGADAPDPIAIGHAVAPMWLREDDLAMLATELSIPAVAEPSAETGVVPSAPLPSETPDTMPLDAEELDVLYRDDALIAVNKPAGLAVHAGEGHREDNLVVRVQGWLESQGVSFEGPLAPANRLDLGASGIVLFALTASARTALGKAFEARDVDKAYWVVLAGRVRKKGVINRSLGDDNGADDTSRTRYRRLAVGERSSLVKASTGTGRKHQIRKHFAGIGYPVLGDRRYGYAQAAAGFRKRFQTDRIMLHARQVTFPHPTTGERIHLVASPDAHWYATLDALGLEQKKKRRKR